MILVCFNLVSFNEYYSWFVPFYVHFFVEESGARQTRENACVLTWLWADQREMKTRKVNSLMWNKQKLTHRLLVRTRRSGLSHGFLARVWKGELALRKQTNCNNPEVAGYKLNPTEDKPGMRAPSSWARKANAVTQKKEQRCNLFPSMEFDLHQCLGALRVSFYYSINSLCLL